MELGGGQAVGQRKRGEESMSFTVGQMSLPIPVRNHVRNPVGTL